MIVAATGHRPDKLGGYSKQVYNRLIDLAKSEISIIGASRVLCGMALGFDMAVADAAIELNIPFVAYIPFIGQEKRWPKSSQDHYNTLLSLAESKVIVCDGGYSPEKMNLRNEAMVNNCDVLLALWNGSSSGTGNCIKYAKSLRQNFIIRNCWNRWEKYK